jgi:hypothetical protein
MVALDMIVKYLEFCLAASRLQHWCRAHIARFIEVFAFDVWRVGNISHAWEFFRLVSRLRSVIGRTALAADSQLRTVSRASGWQHPREGQS